MCCLQSVNTVSADKVAVLCSVDLVYRSLNAEVAQSKNWPFGVSNTIELKNTELFISPSGISELDCATTKTDTAEKSISIGRESLQVFFFVLVALACFHVPPLGGSRDEKWRSQ